MFTSLIKAVVLSEVFYKANMRLHKNYFSIKEVDREKKRQVDTCTRFTLIKT